MVNGFWISVGECAIALVYIIIYGLLVISWIGLILVVGIVETPENPGIANMLGNCMALLLLIFQIGFPFWIVSKIHSKNIKKKGVL